jgi:Protein of unknown function (DUF3987)
MISVQSMANPDYCLLYRKEGNTPQYFTEDDRPTEPRKKVDPKSFQRVQERFSTGRYDGIAVVKDGKVVEHLPGGKPAPPVVHHNALAGANAAPSAVIGSAPSDTALAAQDDAGAGARFSCLRYVHPIGKRFFIDSAGQLQKQTLADGARAVAHIVACGTIEHLERVFREASDSDIFVGGLPSTDELTVVTKAKRGDGEIARSKDDLPFRDGPGVMFLDNDHPVGDGDDQFDAYVKAVPALAAASYVYAPSSSAWIHDAASGRELKGAGGQHYAVPVKDASDIPRALKALHLRLVLAGLGEPMVTKAGTVLIKSPVDTAMQTPNQPLFQRVSLGDGLVQRKTDHIGSHSGEVFLFDSRLIADLTPEEQVRLADVERLLRDSVADRASDVRGEWIEARVESVSARNEVTREVAAEYLRAALTHAASAARSDLIPGIQIKFSNGWVDVGELLASPGKYDGKPCADPLEPDYGSGIGVAKFYANAKGKPTIRSHAHGGQIFFLHHDPKETDLSGILTQGVRQDTDPAQSAGTDQSGGPSDAGTYNPMSNWRPEPAPAQPKALKSISDVRVWEATPVVVPEHLKSFPVTQLNRYLYWFNRCAEDTVNSVSLASVIHLASVVVARGARTNMNNHSSLFMLLIAPTGFGKNYGKNAIVRMLSAANVHHRVSGEFHSKGGVYSAMLASPTIIFHLDEFGDKIKQGLKDGSSINGAFSYVKEVYSASGSVLPAPSYSTVGLSKTQADAIRAVKSPCVNFYCLTTPGQLWEAIDNASVEGGFLNRFVGVMAAGGEALTNDTPAFDPPTELVSHVIEVRNHLAGVGNIGEQKFSNSDIDPGLTEYPFDAESRRLLDEFKREIAEAYRDDEFMANMAARWRENAMRMALALSVFSAPASRGIGASLTKWCIDFVRFYGNQFAKSVLEHSQPKSEYGRMRRDFLLAFRRKPNGTPPSALGQQVPWKYVQARTRKEIIDDLMEAGLLAEVAKATKGQRGPQGKVYVALAET